MLVLRICDEASDAQVFGLIWTPFVAEKTFRRAQQRSVHISVLLKAVPEMVVVTFFPEMVVVTFCLPKRFRATYTLLLKAHLGAHSVQDWWFCFSEYSL